MAVFTVSWLILVFGQYDMTLGQKSITLYWYNQKLPFDTVSTWYWDWGAFQIWIQGPHDTNIYTVTQNTDMLNLYMFYHELLSGTITVTTIEMDTGSTWLMNTAFKWHENT